MRDATTEIAVLRASLATTERTQTRIPLGYASADVCLNGGLVQGTLHEIFAPPSHEAAAAGFAAALAFRLCGGKPLLWIRQDFSAAEHGELAATGFLELGWDPSRLLLLRIADVASALRAAADALTCSALGTVVIEILGEPKLLDLVAHRRLALGAAQHGVTVLLLRFAARPDIGVAETRWLIRAAPSLADDEHWGRPIFDACLARNRHGPTGHWIMEWSSDDGFFTADCGAVVCASSDRPAATALEQVLVA